MNPFDLRGPEFLLFYLILSAAVIAALVLLRRASESESAPKIDLADPCLIAYLRGGENEVLRVALVSLIDRGLLIVNGTQIKRANTAVPGLVRRAVEKALIEKFARSGEAASVFDDPKLKLACEQYQETLKRNRLVPDESVTRARVKRFVVALVILAGVGGIKVIVALGRGRTNVAFLIILMVAAIALAAKASFPRLTAGSCQRDPGAGQGRPCSRPSPPGRPDGRQTDFLKHLRKQRGRNSLTQPHSWAG